MDNLANSNNAQWLNEWESLSRLHPIYHYAGPWDAPIVVVGQREKGAILPFITSRSNQFVWECLRIYSLAFGWTYAQEVPPQHLRSKNGIISCGEKASKWLRFHVDGDVPMLHIPTPRYLLTQQAPADIATVYDSVREFVENHIKEGK